MSDLTGDNFLAVFPTASSAFRAAVAVTGRLERLNDGRQSHQKLRFRMGIAIGELISHREALYGDVVNVAARLREVAEPATIAVEVVHRWLTHLAAAGLCEPPPGARLSGTQS